MYSKGKMEVVSVRQIRNILRVIGQVLYVLSPVVKAVFFCLTLGAFAAEIVLAVRWTRRMTAGCSAAENELYRERIRDFMRWPFLCSAVFGFPRFLVLLVSDVNPVLARLGILLLPLIPYMALLVTTLLKGIAWVIVPMRKLVSQERKPLLTVVCAVVIALNLGVYLQASPVCMWCGKVHLVHNYYAGVGLYTSSKYPSLKTVLFQLGEPKEIRREVHNAGTRTVYDYGGFSLLFDDGDGSFYGLEIVSPVYKLRSNVHVGSTREQIIQAYSHVTPVKEEPNGGAYFDYRLDRENYGDVWTNYVEFEYDENDRVTKITYLSSL